MLWHVARGLAGLIATLLVAATLIYLLTRFGPAAAVPPNSLWGWFGDVLVGNLGAPQLGAALAVTVPLTLLALLLAGGIGTGLGILAARRPGSVADRSLALLTGLGVALPNIWLGMLLVLLFSSSLRWLPLGGFVPWQVNPFAALASLLLPALALALPQAAVIARIVRRAIGNARTSDYVLAAQGRGFTARQAMQRHGLANARLAVLSLAGRHLAPMLAGALIVENVFYLSGLGRLIFDAVAARDLAAVRGGLIVVVLGTAIIVFVGHVCAALADPRLRASQGA